MDIFKLIEIKEKLQWERFLLSKNPQTFLQSWNWGEVEKSLGNKIFRLGLTKKGNIVGVSLIIKETAKRGAYLLIAAGPIMDWDDKQLVSFFIKEIKKIALKERCWFVRIRPELLDSQHNRVKFKELGFVPAPMHVHAENTWVLDIQKTDEELLSGMRKSTRYLVKKSLNSGFKVTSSENPQVSKLLFSLQKETAQRHGFVGFSQELFASEIKYFGKDREAKVFICWYKGKPLAAAIIIFYGDCAYYHFSGSVSDYNKLPFSYFLQWDIIQEAKKRGKKYYNFWGIAPNASPKHRFAGVTLFKMGFGGEGINWLHAQDLPVANSYWLTYVFETFRRIYRRL